MNTWYLYLLLASISFPLTLVIASWLGREIGSQKLSLLRQCVLAIIWLPILYSLKESWNDLLREFPIILACGITGAIYLVLAFQATSYTQVALSRSFVTIARTILALCIWYFIFHEYISLFDILWVGLIVWGVLRITRSKIHRITRSDTIGILFSASAGGIYVLNSYFFKELSISFTALQSAYLLEISSIIPLTALYFLFYRDTSTARRIEFRAIKIMCFIAPLILLGSYGLAQSIEKVPFFAYNSLLVLGFIMSIIFGKIILWEHVSLSRFASMSIITLWCLMIIVG